MNVRTALVLASSAASIAAPWAQAAAPLTVRASVDPTSVSFGDPFTYTVEVDADEDAVDAATVSVVADTGPFETLAPARTERASSGGVTILTLTQTLGCLELACAPEGSARHVVLPPARAQATSHAGAEAEASAPAAAVDVRPRVPAAAVAAPRPEYRRDTGLPGATTRVLPDLLALVLSVAAATLGVVALALVVAGLGRRRAPTTRVAPIDPLARALRFVRESAGRAATDRRRAADLLARALGERGAAPLADEATLVAWSAHEPVPADATVLADRVQGSLREPA